MVMHGVNFGDTTLPRQSLEDCMFAEGGKRWQHVVLPRLHGGGEIMLLCA